ncbi:hypothetical protein GQ55_9G598100 [Panicum hallii var. hallii]|uniref:Uncharacterized protein n=1 Tax=Panicum hallii var. hallii TaxID=1504633 RepID=A0A2T7CH21_9POAL|nr:hypothetical protein GQ55_9G598100 [Panicum hallii var. hallii]
MLAVSASSSFYYCGALAPAPAQIQTSLISVSGYPSRQSSRHGDDKTACAPNGQRQRLARPRGTPVRRIAPLGRQAGLPRAMALPRAALGHPFSPCHARPGFRLSTSTTGSGPSFAYSRTQHPAVGAQRRAYPRIEATARRGARTESPKVRNRRLQKKFNGTATKPRLSVFCSNRQLYAVLADDHNKKILFYGSTLQKSICGDPPCSTVEASRRVGEELVRACEELGISEISYDRNSFARGEKMMAFEVPVSQHGFLPR